jgi:hypothetical protein
MGETAIPASQRETDAMPIQRQRVYTDDEVDQIVRASETRLSRRGEGPTGHLAAQHVLITNAELIDRGDTFRDRNVDVPLVCAFVSTREAVHAVTEALNSPQGQDALQHLDNNYPTGIRATVEALVTPLRVRYSSGWDVLRRATVDTIRMVLERIEEETYHGLHVHTAFPVLAFRQGQPAWQDSQRHWH